MPLSETVSTAEASRLAVVNELDMLDTPPEESFDRLTRLVHNIFEVPIALVSLMDLNRQWHKSCIGVPQGSILRQEAFCRFPVASEGAPDRDGCHGG